MLVTAILAVLLLAVQAWVILVYRAYLRSMNEDRAYSRERITDLERALLAHGWQDYAQIAATPTPLARSTAVTNGWGEDRPEEAYGENEHDVIESFLASNGIDLEGPTLG